MASSNNRPKAAVGPIQRPRVDGMSHDPPGLPGQSQHHHQQPGPRPHQQPQPQPQHHQQQRQQEQETDGPTVDRRANVLDVGFTKPDIKFEGNIRKNAENAPPGKLVVRVDSERAQIKGDIEMNTKGEPRQQ